MSECGDCPAPIWLLQFGHASSLKGRAPGAPSASVTDLALLQSIGSTNVRSASSTRLIAIGLMVSALLFFSCIDTTAKFLGRALPSVEVAWARYMVAALIALFLSGAHRNRGVWVSKRLDLQILRSFLLLGSTVANFYALTKLQLAETSTINFLQPMFVALMAGPLIGEKVGAARLAAIVSGFLGVVIAMQPGTRAFQPIALVSVLGVACAAGYALTTRKLAAIDAPQTTLAWTQAAGVLVLTPVLPFLWRTPPSPVFWAGMFMIGLFGAVGHQLLIIAHRFAPAAVLAPFNYTQLLWGIGLGFLVFGDKPPLATLGGAVVVVLCGLFLIVHERRAAIRQ